MEWCGWVILMLYHIKFPREVKVTITPSSVQWVKYLLCVCQRVTASITSTVKPLISSWSKNYNHIFQCSASYIHAMYRPTCHGINYKYRQTSYIRGAVVGTKIVDHSDVVGTSSVGAAPIISSFSFQSVASIYSTKTTARRDEKHLSFGIRCVLYEWFDGSLVARF